MRRRCDLILALGLAIAMPPRIAGAQAPVYRVYVPAIQSTGGMVSGTLAAYTARHSGPIVDATIYLGIWLKDAKGRWAGVAYDRLHSPHTWTDDDGAFSFTGVPPGRYSLILDTIVNAYLLHDPITGGALYVDLPAHGIVDMGQLVYPEWPE